MTSTLIAPPGVEPVTVADMRAHLRLTGPQEDALLSELVVAARQQVERETGRALIAQGWRLYLEHWPVGRIIQLPVAPVIAVTEITAYDHDGNAHVLDAGDYALDRSVTPARVRVKVGAGVSSSSLNGLEVDFTAGYGETAEDVPVTLKQAIRLLAAHWFENREAGTQAVQGSLPHGLDRLLAVNKVLKL
ncbi:head-tail connector protein [Roseibium sp.]|uniref:head-tail connector protein n=1 Tax=Roseibium sp. TaxID=1936156 RepID=UPI003A96AF74